MITFGLTGGIACGKSTVNKVFTACNIPMVDADVVARQVVEAGTEGLYKVAQTFGAEYINADGSLNRAKLGALVFLDKTALSRLNAVMFPLIFEDSENQIAKLHNSGHAIVGYDSALIVEMGLVGGFKPLVVVHCSVEDQVARIIKRNGLTRAEALLRIGAQLSNEEKLKYASYSIDTSGSKEETGKRVIEIVESLHELEKHSQGRIW